MTEHRPPALSPTDEPARFSVDEFMALCMAGVLPEGEQFELVDGVITRSGLVMAPHRRMQRDIFRKLDSIFGDGLDGLIAQFELSLLLGPDTVREADVAIQRDPGPIDGLNDPATVLLIIEVAQSSIARDLHAKRLAYAGADIPHYWVVDLGGQRTHVMHAPLGGDYSERTVVAFGASLTVPGCDRHITIG